MLLQKLVNRYSSGIVGTLIILFFSFYLGAIYIDSKDDKSKNYLKNNNYDNMQYYIVKFSLDRIKKDSGLFKFYFYLIKVKFTY